MKILRAAPKIAIVAAALCFGQLAGADVIVIDNTDADAVATGTWVDSTAVAGYIGDNYQHNNQNAESYFDYNIGAVSGFFDGSWLIEMNWTSHPNRADNVVVYIMSSLGTVVVDQTVNGGMWNTIGTYNLDSASVVRISSMNTNGYVIADAFRFTSPSAVPEPGTVALLGLGLLGMGLSRRRKTQ